MFKCDFSTSTFDLLTLTRSPNQKVRENMRSKTDSRSHKIASKQSAVLHDNVRLDTMYWLYTQFYEVMKFTILNNYK